MAERRVQYLMVDTDAAPWSSEAPSFKTQVADFASLEKAVCQQVMPQHTRLLLRDADNMWVAWNDVSELPQDCTLCVKAVRTADSKVERRLLQMKEQIKEEIVQQITKRHKTDFTETPLRLANKGVLWQQEVQDKVACNIAEVDDMLQPIDPLLAALRYLSLLYHGRGQDAKDLLHTKRCRKRGQADEERPYYPYMLTIFQAAAAGQPEIQFQLEDFARQDTTRQDLRCFVDNVEGHPGKAKARNVSSNPVRDPDGIHNNKDTFGKLYEVIKVKFLWSGHDAVFFCPFVVRIECCWIAKFDFSMEGCDQDTYPEIMPSLPSNSSKSHATWWCAVQAP